jgi:transposase
VLDFRLLNLIATVIDFCTPPTEQGHPRSTTVRVLATLRQFLREGTPWRSLKATADKVSGSTLRRHLEQWASIGLLAQVHAVLIGMLRGDPILDTCSVRAKRGGDLTDPTDRGKRGTKYHIAGDGVPVACAATAANVNDTLVFERLFLAAFAVMARIRTVFADKGYDAEHHRDLCREFGAEPCIHKRGQAQVWASGAGRSSAAMLGFWRVWAQGPKRASLCAMTASASSSSHCSKPHASSWLQDAWPRNCENRL